MNDRLISLTVGTKGAEEWYRTYQDLSELANNLGASHHYVSVSSSDPGDDGEEPTCDPEGLYHDEYTVHKVHQAIRAGSALLSEAEIMEIISSMQNFGIVFRERPKQS